MEGCHDEDLRGAALARILPALFGTLLFVGPSCHSQFRLNDAQMAEFDDAGGAYERVTFNEGDIIMQQGDRGDAFYLVESGMTSVSANGNFIKEMGAGSHFGELALLRHGAQRTATVAAVSSPTVVLKVTAHTFEKKIKPNLARFTNKIGKAGANDEMDPAELGKILAKMLKPKGGDDRGKYTGESKSRDPDGAMYCKLQYKCQLFRIFLLKMQKE